MASSGLGVTTVQPDHPHLYPTGFVCFERTADGLVGSRPAGTLSAFAVDAPGATIEFATAAPACDLLLAYPAQEQMPAGRVHFQGQGVVLVDGAERAAFDRPGPTGGALAIPVPLGTAGLVRRVQVLLPYADRVVWHGVRLPAQSGLHPESHHPRPRYAACGDSITQGFLATGPDHTYAWRLAATRGWELLNLGYGSRTATAEDGMAAAALRPNVVSLLVGVNDCLGQVPLAEYRGAVAGWLEAVRRGAPAAQVYLITPLPVPGRWPGTEGLEQYRAVLRQLASERCDPRLQLIEGGDLLPDDGTLCQDGLHPNDQGARVMAAALAARLAPTLTTTTRR